VLNVVLEQRWAALSGKYNETGLVDSKSDAVIVHFVGATKPWMFGARHPNRSDYMFYRSQTPFWPFVPQSVGKFLVRRLIPRPLRKPKKLWRRIWKRV